MKTYYKFKNKIYDSLFELKCKTGIINPYTIDDLILKGEITEVAFFKGNCIEI